MNVAQGVFRPLTPMGIQAMRLVRRSLATAFGPRRPTCWPGPATFVEAGHRVFLDVTPGAAHIRSGEGLSVTATRFMEARTRALAAELTHDPRLADARRHGRSVAQMWRGGRPPGRSGPARAGARPAGRGASSGRCESANG